MIGALIPWSLAAFVVVEVYISKRIGRLRVRPQDSSIVRTYAMGLLAVMMAMPVVFAALEGAVSLWSKGEMPTSGPLLLSTGLAWTAAWWSLRRLPTTPPPDPVLARYARLVLGWPIGAAIISAVVAILCLAGAPTFHGELLWNLLTGALVTFALSATWLCLSAGAFLYPMWERADDGTLHALRFEELRRRWAEPATPATEAPTAAAAASSSQSRAPRQKAAQ